MWIYFVFGLVLVSSTVFADERQACLNGLQRCHDENIYAMDRYLDTGKMSKLRDACLLYSSALKCLNTLPCEETSEYRQKRRMLKRNLDKEIAGACLPSGATDPCLNELIKCYIRFAEAEDYFKNRNVKSGCLEVILYDSCVEEAKKRCPPLAVIEMDGDVMNLTVEAHRQGCKPECTKSLEACTFELKSADAEYKDEYCVALRDTKSCLQTLRDDAGCSDADSQRYLKEAVSYKGSKFNSECDRAASSGQASVFVLLSMLATAWFSRWL